MHPLEETHTYRWVGETLESIFDGGTRITGFAPIRDSAKIHCTWQGYVVELGQAGVMNGPALFKITTSHQKGTTNLEFMGNDVTIFTSDYLPEREALAELKQQTTRGVLELLEPWVA
jgi:hypothetical protein